MLTRWRGALYNSMKDISTKYLPGDVDLMKGGSSRKVILIENFSGTPWVLNYKNWVNPFPFLLIPCFRLTRRYFSDNFSQYFKDILLNISHFWWNPAFVWPNDIFDVKSGLCAPASHLLISVIIIIINKIINNNKKRVHRCTIMIMIIMTMTIIVATSPTSSQWTPPSTDGLRFTTFRFACLTFFLSKSESDSVFKTRGRKMHLPKVLSNKYQSLKRKLKWKVQPSFQLTFIYFRNIAFMSNELILMICTISLEIILMVKSNFWFYEKKAYHFFLIFLLFKKS